MTEVETSKTSIEGTEEIEASPDQRRESARGRLAALTILALCLARLFTMGDLPTCCRNLPVDDLLYARGADSIVEGRWLGHYDENTLVKMPGFPLFLAALRLGGIPFQLGRELLWITACLVLYRTTRRLGLGRATALLVFGATLWHPASTWSLSTLLVRETIHHSQLLLIVALLASFMAPGSSWRRLFAALSLALVTAFCWYSREESIWLLGIFGFALPPIFLVERRRANLMAALLLLVVVVLPSAIAVVAAGRAIEAQNLEHYGAKAIVAFEDEAFSAALGAIARAEPEPEHERLPIRDETLRELYPHSPALASLRSVLDSTDMRAPGMTDQEGNRLFNYTTFAMRSAAARLGHHRTLRDAQAFYAELAEEVNAYLDRDMERYGPRFSTSSPPVRSEDVPRILKKTGRLCLDMAELGFQGEPYSVRPVVDTTSSDCDPVTERLMLRVVGEPETRSMVRWAWRWRLMHEILAGYRAASPYLVILGLLVAVLRLAFWRRSRPGGAFFAGLILVATAVLRALLVAVLWSIYTPTEIPYLVVGYALLLPGMLLLIGDGWIALTRSTIGRVSLFASPVLGGIALVGLLAGMFALSESAVDSADRFLNQAETRALCGDSMGLQPQVSLVRMSGGLAPSGDLTLRIEDKNPAIGVYPYLRRRSRCRRPGTRPPQL